MTPTTGVLATECLTCEGSGLLPENHGQGNVEWLGCPDCRATGWVIHGATPVVTVEFISVTLNSMHRDTSCWDDDHFFNQSKGWNDALLGIAAGVMAEFPDDGMPTIQEIAGIGGWG